MTGSASGHYAKGYRPVVPVTSRAVSEPVWRALRVAEAPLTVIELHRITAAAPNAIQLRLKRWERAGLVSATSFRPRTYTMVDTAPRPPRMTKSGLLERKTTGRQRMWNAIRVQKRFDMPWLMYTADVSRRAAETYLNHLIRAGYLRTIERGCSRRGTWSSYLLVRNTGRLAPAITHSRVPTDRNSVVLIDRNDNSRHDISPSVVSLRTRRTGDRA